MTNASTPCTQLSCRARDVLWKRAGRPRRRPGCSVRRTERPRRVPGSAGRHPRRRPRAGQARSPGHERPDRDLGEPEAGTVAEHVGRILEHGQVRPGAFLRRNMPAADPSSAIAAGGSKARRISATGRAVLPAGLPPTSSRGGGDQMDRTPRPHARGAPDPVRRPLSRPRNRSRPALLPRQRPIRERDGERPDTHNACHRGHVKPDHRSHLLSPHLPPRASSPRSGEAIRSRFSLPPPASATRMRRP